MKVSICKSDCIVKVNNIDIHKLKQYNWVKQIFQHTNKPNILEFKTGNLSDGSLQPSREEGCTTFFFWQYFQKNGRKNVKLNSKTSLALGKGQTTFRISLSCLVWPQLIPPLDVRLHQKYCRYFVKVVLDAFITLFFRDF